MSRIAKKMKELEEEKERGLYEEAKTSVTLRLPALSIHSLDYLAKTFGKTRTGMATILLEDALLESMESLGHKPRKQLEMFIDSVRSDGKSTDLKGEI